MAQHLLALDLGSHTLKAVLFERTLRDCRVRGFFHLRRDPQRSLADQVRELCSMHGRRGVQVLSCLPGDVVLHRFLSFPFTRPQQLHQTVPFELESRLPFALEDLLVDFQLVNRTAEGGTVLAVAVPKSTLAAHLQLLAEAGCDPAGVGLSCLAPFALLSLAGVAKDSAAVLLDIGEQRTSVVVLREGKLGGMRTLSVGLSREGGFDAFVRELRWTLLALEGGDSLVPSRFLLAGGGAHFPRLREELARAMSAEVCPLQQLVLPHVPAVHRKEQAEFAVCLGLGFREALGLATPGVNLRRGEFAHRGRREIVRRELARLGWVAAGVTAAAGLAFSLELYRLNSRYHSVRQEIRRVFTAALPEVRTIVNEKAQLQYAVDGLRHQRRLFGGTATVSPLEVLRQLSSALPERVALDVDEWVFDEHAVRLRGTTDSFDAAEAVKSAAAALGLFREVQLKDVKAASGGEKVSFGLQMVFASENQ